MSDEKTGFLHYLRQAWLVLALSICFGAALAGVEQVTRPRIEQNIKDFIGAKLVELFGEGTEVGQARTLTVDMAGRADPVSVTCYPAIRDGRRVGWGVRAEGKGYDKLLLLIGVDDRVERLLGYRVITSLETEGIGDVIEKPSFYEQFRGKDATAPLVPVPQGQPTRGNQVNTVTGATYSTKRGVVGTINATLAAVREKLRAVSKGGG